MDTVLIQGDGPVVTVVLNRPDKAQRPDQIHVGPCLAATVIEALSADEQDTLYRAAGRPADRAFAPGNDIGGIRD